MGYILGISSVPVFLTTKFWWWRLLLGWVDFNVMQCVRTRKADGGRHRVYVWANRVVHV